MAHTWNAEKLRECRKRNEKYIEIPINKTFFYSLITIVAIYPFCFLVFQLFSITHSARCTSHSLLRWFYRSYTHNIKFNISSHSYASTSDVKDGECGTKKNFFDEERVTIFFVIKLFNGCCRFPFVIALPRFSTSKNIFFLHLIQ